MSDSENKKKYKSPYSVSKRQTIFLDSKDPRVKDNISDKSATNTFNKTGEKFRSVAGVDVIIKDSPEDIDLDDYIFQCIYDGLQVSAYSANLKSVSDIIILDGTQYFTDEVSVLLLDIDLINVEDFIILNGTQYYEDSLNVFVPTELFEIFVSDTVLAEGSIIGDGSLFFSDIFGLLYAITYDGNGRDEGSPPFDPISYPAGSNVTVLDSGSLIRYGYLFTGWNTQANGSGTTYQPGDQIIGINDFITLYAIWTNVYQVIYYGNDNNEGFIPVDSNLYFNSNIATVLGQGTLIKYGKTFAGWNTQANGSGTNYEVGDTIVISGANINLYAKWV
jgi:uncharacterized repeat protein (TIGR02543 family)